MANGTVGISRFGPSMAMAIIFLDTDATSVSLVASGTHIEVLGIHCYYEGATANTIRLTFTDLRATATDILFDATVGSATIFSPKAEKVFSIPAKCNGLQVDVAALVDAASDARVNVEFRYL